MASPAIGFFDSGLGGISVLADAVKALPREDFLYLGDSANAPYGVKAPDEVLRLVRNAAGGLARMGVKALVIACNTASSVAASALRGEYAFPIIALEPALKPAAESGGTGAILVMATPLTLSSKSYRRLHARYGERAVPLPCPGLMEFVEREELDSPGLHEYLDNLLSPFSGQQVDAAVLGCTHYLFLREAIRSHLPRGTRLMDSNAGVVRQLIRRLEGENLLTQSPGPGKVEIVSTGGRDKAEQMERMLRRYSER